MKIAIIGSQNSDKFIKRMKEAEKYFLDKGFLVFVPDSFENDSLVTERMYQNKMGREKFLSMKPIWTVAHGKKIEDSDFVLVMNCKKNNINGYIGPNTLMELSLALYFGKKIFFLYPIDENHPFFEEIAGIDFVVLNGDLSKIK